MSSIIVESKNAQAQANNLQLNPIDDELKDLTDLETILISQLNPYTHYCCKTQSRTIRFERPSYTCTC